MFQKKTLHNSTNVKHHHHNTGKPHPALKWIIAMIVGLLSSILLMMSIVIGFIEQADSIGTTLVFKSFFLYTGGLILLQQAHGSIFMFIVATLYYFIFFALVGLIIGYITEFLVALVNRN